MDEFQLIRRYFAGLTPPAPGLVLGIGDDAAVLDWPAERQLVVSTDTLIAGRHFPEATSAYDVGWKALAVNLSDLAAMGAEPVAGLLALTLPAVSDDWLQDFARGFGGLAERHGLCLIGGDLTRGPLSLTVTVIGAVPRGQALTRAGARPGDRVLVTGTLGDAALALRQGPGSPLRARLDRPEPRVAAGLAARGRASAALDLSDGLAGDLRHVLAASGVGACIEVDRLPASSPFERQGLSTAERRALQLAGGDDYELCLCVPPAQEAALREALAPLRLSAIGQITAEPGLRFVDGQGQPLDLPYEGYRHF
ncbi:MAG TPA: thiamine-phosphate kinase [Nevskiaceae bacterium]|nr:thiamine-phosphate kinase [Nevskiaceae bacterium]